MLYRELSIPPSRNRKAILEKADQIMERLLEQTYRTALVLGAIEDHLFETGDAASVDELLSVVPARFRESINQLATAYVKRNQETKEAWDHFSRLAETWKSVDKGTAFFNDMTAGKSPVGAIELRQQYGCFVMAFEKEADYDAFFEANKYKVKGKTGGVFHRALKMRLAYPQKIYEFPVILVNASSSVSPDAFERIEKHERQHFIHDHLSLFALPQESNKRGLTQSSILGNKIKDEILAYFREGRTAQQTIASLRGPLYAHLFEAFPEEEREGVYQLAENVVHELFSSRLSKFGDKGRRLFLYAVLDQPLEDMRKNLSFMNEYFERTITNRLEQADTLMPSGLGTDMLKRSLWNNKPEFQHLFVRGETLEFELYDLRRRFERLLLEYNPDVSNPQQAANDAFSALSSTSAKFHAIFTSLETAAKQEVADRIKEVDRLTKISNEQRRVLDPSSVFPKKYEVLRAAAFEALKHLEAEDEHARKAAAAVCSCDDAYYAWSEHYTETLARLKSLQKTYDTTIHKIMRGTCFPTHIETDDSIFRPAVAKRYQDAQPFLQQALEAIPQTLIDKSVEAFLVWNKKGAHPLQTLADKVKKMLMDARLISVLPRVTFPSKKDIETKGIRIDFYMVLAGDYWNFNLTFYFTPSSNIRMLSQTA